MSLRNRPRFHSPVPRSRLTGLLTFTSEELHDRLVVMLRSTSIGAIGDERPGDKRSRVEDDDDSGGGDTDVKPSIEESVGSLLTEAKAALRDAAAQSAEELRELQARLFNLAERKTTPPVLRQQLTRAQLRLQRVEVARDAEATQVDDGVEVAMETEIESGGGSGSSGPPPQEDSYAVRSKQPGDEEVLEKDEFLVSRLLSERRVGRGTNRSRRTCIPAHFEQYDTTLGRARIRMSRLPNEPSIPTMNLYISITLLILCAFDSFCAFIASGQEAAHRVSGALGDTLLRFQVGYLGARGQRVQPGPDRPIRAP